MSTSPATTTPAANTIATTAVIATMLNDFFMGILPWNCGCDAPTCNVSITSDQKLPCQPKSDHFYNRWPLRANWIRNRFISTAVQEVIYAITRFGQEKDADRLIDGLADMIQRFLFE
jgi:hypothetical protein